MALATSQGRYLFNRSWSLTIGVPGQQGLVYSSSDQALGVVNKNNMQTTGPVADVPPSGARIVFDIDKVSSGTANKAKFEIYNQSKESRRALTQVSPSLVQVKFRAGYTGLPGSTPLVQTIFIGNISTIANAITFERRESDIVTKIECGEAEVPITFAVFNQSFPAGTSLLSIILSLANALVKASSGDIQIGTISGVPSRTSNKGEVCDGSIFNSLNKYTTPFGLQWNVTNGVLNINPISQPVNTQAILLSNQNGVSISGQTLGYTGLIGVPSVITMQPPDPPVGPLYNCNFVSLLNPYIIPQSYVQIFSEMINGSTFCVRRAHFEGDTHGEKWQVAGEGIQVEALTPVIGNQSIGSTIA